MKKYSNHSPLVAEVCKRQRKLGQEITGYEVKSVLRHIEDLIQEEWLRGMSFDIIGGMRLRAMKRIRKENLKTTTMGLVKDDIAERQTGPPTKRRIE